MAKALAFLIVFNVLFFWKAWTDPFSLATSELLSTYFPTWVWQGREWAKGKVPKYDPHYWINAHAHPVVSTYYPIQFLVGLAASRLPRDVAWVFFCYSLLLHFMLASWGWFCLFSAWAFPITALFGAITLTYSAYNIKQQPCFIYTIAWFPWLLLGIAKCSILLSSVAFGMILLAGYYPIGIQATLIAVCASVWWDSPLTWIPIGTLIGLPQLIPFLRYLPKTIRSNKHDNIGTLTRFSLLNLVLPEFNNPKDVGFWEMACYVGIVPLVLVVYAIFHFSISAVLVLGIASLCLAFGAFSQHFPRIPARWLWTFQFSLGWAVVGTLNRAALLGLKPICVLLLIQAFDLWYHNRKLMPTRPYAELAKRPSRAFNTKLTRFLQNRPERVSGLPWPLFTGHINRIKTLGYCGGMQLKLMAKWRNDKNPNGSGEHDYFRSNKDNGDLTRYRCKFAFSRKKLDWRNTPIRHLYENPDYR